MSTRFIRGTVSVISTWATELCITALYQRLGCDFSDGVQGGLRVQDGTLVRWLLMWLAWAKISSNICLV